MKKITAALLAIFIAFTIATPFVYAATKNDLLGKAKATVFGKYISIASENSFRAIPMTAEQGDKLMVILDKALAYLGSDKGPSAHDYGDEAIAYILTLVAEACDIMECTFDFVPSDNPDHPGDIVFRVFDKNGNIVFRYDGDYPIEKTDSPDDGASANSNLYLIGGLVTALLAAGAFAASKKVKQIS